MDFKKNSNADKFKNLNDKLNEIGCKYGVSPTSVVTAWILRHPANIQMISGTVKEERLKEIVKGTEFTLTREEWYEIYLAAGKMLP